MGNLLDRVFMESYLPTRSVVRIKNTCNNDSNNVKTQQITKQILDMIPSKRNFNIKNNIAISTTDYIENNIPISELSQVEGLNECHRVLISREQHVLIAKVNLYTSTTMY